MSRQEMSATAAVSAAAPNGYAPVPVALSGAARTIPPAAAPEQVPASRLFTVLSRRKWFIAAVMLTVVPAAVVIIRHLPRYFDAQASLMINTRRAAFRDLQATVETTDPDASTVGTQVGVIRSLSMALRVVDRLNLTHVPEFAGKLDAPPSALAVVKARIDGLLGVSRPPAPALTAEDRRQLTAQMVSDLVTVTNDGHSYIITIQARTAEPALSSAIANAFSDLYLDFNRELKIAAIRRANSLLDDEMAPMRERLRAADEAMETYKQNNGLVTGRSEVPGTQAGGATVPEEQLAQINAQLVAETGELTAKMARLRQIQEAQRTGRLESVPEVVESSLISTLRAQQTDLSSRVASLEQSALPGNPALRSAAAGDADIQRRINAEVGKVAASMASQVASAQARVATLRGALDKLQVAVAGESRANVTLRQLESEASAARGVYQDYLGRFEHTSSDGALQEPEADLISAAPVPLSPSGPPRGQYIILAVAASLGLGTFLALMLDRLHTGVRSSEQLEAETGLLSLGLIPRVARGIMPGLERRAPSLYNSAVGLIANVLRFGSEQFRARVVMVTSAVPGEGKTVFAISLATQLGRDGGRSLLIDCDLYKPSIAAELGLLHKEQRATPLDGGEATAFTLHPNVLPGLDVLTCRPSSAHGAADIIVALRRLIADARDRYDLIVLDTPPVLAFADAPIFSLQADGTIVVVRWRHTPVAAVTTAVRMLQAYSVRLLGGVVTMVKIGELDAAEGGQAHLYRTHARYFGTGALGFKRLLPWSQRA